MLVMNPIAVGIACLEVRVTLGLTGSVAYILLLCRLIFITDDTDYDFTDVIFYSKYL